MNSIIKTAANSQKNSVNQMRRMAQNRMEYNTQRQDWGSPKKKRKNKVMYGQYIRNVDRQLISKEDTFLCLSNGDLKTETESEIVAA